MVRKQHLLTIIALTTIGASAESPTNPNEALLTAAKNANDQAIIALLKAGADINYTNNNRNTRLIDRDGESALIKAAVRGHNTTVAILLNAGANIEHIDNNGETALTVAATEGHEAVVKTLLDAGANINHTGPYGATPFLWAVFEGHANIVKILIDAGADFNHIYGNTTALLSAAGNGHAQTVKILLDSGANPLSDDEIQSFDAIQSYNEMQSSMSTLSSATIQQMQHQTNQERRQGLRQLCEYIDANYNVPRDIQRLIVRDMLGTVPEQMPFQ